MNARGLEASDVARRLGEGHDRATFYRLLKGATTDPRLDTLLGLCRVLDVSPTELLQLAGLWPYITHTADALDVRMRDAFAQLQSLPPDDKRRAVSVVACVAECWKDQQDEEQPDQEQAGYALAEAKASPP